MDRVWHFTWTTYGTRLPGDARGFVSNVRGEDGRGVRLNTRGTDLLADVPPLERYMNARLAGPPVYLTAEHAALLLPQFQETAAHREWTLLAVAVMANHVHLVAGVLGDPDPSDVLGDFKSYGSRPLNRRWGKPASGTWWTEGGSKRKKADGGEILEAIRYVGNQENPLVVWVAADTVRAHFGERAEEFLASGGREPPVATNDTSRSANSGRQPPVATNDTSRSASSGRQPPVEAETNTTSAIPIGNRGLTPPARQDTSAIPIGNRGLTPPARQNPVQHPHAPRRATYIEALAQFDGPGPSLFLAGGISGTFDWQADMAARLADLPLVLLNPRRHDFPIDDPAAAPAQLEWEFTHLRRATAVLFWFPPETLCPIALFELGGRAVVREQPLFVGTHPDYARRLDVVMQLKLARPEVAVVSDTAALAEQVRAWVLPPSS